MPIYRAKSIAEIQREKNNQDQTRNPFSAQYKQKTKQKNSDKKTLTKAKTSTDFGKKLKLKIYKRNGKHFIEPQAAYALGFIGHRLFMKNDMLFELTPMNLDHILHDDNIEKEFVELKDTPNKLFSPNKTDIENDKGGNGPEDSETPSIQSDADYQKILKVYVKGDKTYIDHSAAFALGLTKVRDIMLDKPHLVEIHQDTIAKCKHDDTIVIEYTDLEEQKKAEERKGGEVKPKYEDAKQEDKKYSKADLRKMMLANFMKLKTDEQQIEEVDNNLNKEEDKTIDSKDEV